MSEMQMETGTVWIAVDLALAADTGRAKHTDPVEQGAWIFRFFEEWLGKQPPVEGAAVLRMRYFGTDPNGEPVLETD